MRERYVFVLVSLNPDSTDISGVEFPESGYVESKKFQPDKDIRNGLYGTLWGRVNGGHWLNTDTDAKWCVVKVENNDEIIEIDPVYNFVKFRKGMIVSTGVKEECSKYICSHCPEKDKCDKNECSLLALDTELEEQDSHVFRRGAFSISKTEEAGCHALNAGESGVSESGGWCSHAIALAPGSKSESKGPESISLVAGPSSQSVSKNIFGIAISTDIDSISVVGNRGYAVGLGEYSSAQAGDRGVIALKYNDGKRDRLKIGYVGEDIEKDKAYRINESGEFEEVEPS
jgi:hypothetical protein